MASKRNKQQMEIMFNKYLSQHPEFKEQFSIDKTLNNVECAFIIAIDYMLRYKEMTKEEVDQFFEHCRLQFRCIGDDGWDTYFDEMNETLKEEYGVEVFGQLLRRNNG